MPINGCQNCIEACPAKVLQPLDIHGLPTEELSSVMKIGTATLDTNMCIPYAKKQPCLACWEICPVVGAITIHGGQGKGKGGSTRKPEFNPDVCVGCGACEYACPTSPKAVQIKPDGTRKTEWK
jgi:ferredoxin